MIESQECRGKKIRGFFGMFDILGYRDLIANNDIDTVIKIYESSVLNRDLLALAFGNSHIADLSPSAEAERLAFSDTFILYQEFFSEENPLAKVQRASAFIIYSCYLLRLAFDSGIPLRGAISFGEYYVDRKNFCFLGAPVIEAYDLGNHQEWSGAVLCNSAREAIKTILDNLEVKNRIQNIKCNFEECENCGRLCPFDPDEMLIEYDVPYDKSTSKSIALRWDDFVARSLFVIGIHNINTSNYRDTIKEVHGAFSAHKKNTSQEKVMKKIENTSNFLNFISNKFSKDFSLTEWHGSLMPSKIKKKNRQSDGSNP